MFLQVICSNKTTFIPQVYKDILHHILMVIFRLFKRNKLKEDFYEILSSYFEYEKYTSKISSLSMHENQYLEYCYKIVFE